MKLLVAALDSELQAFPETLAGWDRLVTGPGKLLAAVGLSEMLDRRPEIDEILVLGTAGRTDPDLPVGTYEIGAAIQHDVTDLEGVEGRHVALPARLELDRPGVTIATGDSFVGNSARSEQIRLLGAQLLDMEAYAYAWVAQRRRTPLRIVKTVSDDAGEGAETLWDEVVAECSAKLWDWFSSSL